MRPDVLTWNWRRDGLRNWLPEHWGKPIGRLALAWLALLLLTAGDWIAMAGQWWDSSTYNHILFVPPILGWLVWVRREELARLHPTGWWPGLVLLGGALFVWLLGSVAGVNLVSQLGAVLALQAALLAMLGPRVGAGLLFPLGYMVFLVPFGDEMVPALQMVTAKITVWLVHLSGVPAEIEGVFIDTPVGLFEVAEACSGVKFLVAMIALGTLVAHCCFTQWRRRALFMVAAIALPILANGVRAWGTIYIAQSQGIEFAVGFDHIFYGWVFFALVIALLLGLSWKFFDRAPEDASFDVDAVQQSPLISRLVGLHIEENVALAVLAALLVTFAGWNTLASKVMAETPAQLDLPAVRGWQLVDYQPQVHWEPRATGAEHRLLGRYRDNRGREVDVFFAFYASQGEGKEAGGFGEGALDYATAWRWLEDGQGTSAIHAEYLLAPGRVKRRAETSYRTGEMLTGSTAQLKLASMANRLLLRERPTLMLILSAEQAPGNDPEQAISAFRQAIGSDAEWMDRIAKLR